MKKYGRLIIVEEHGEKYLCKCDCGKIKEIRKYDVLNGKTKSCGCLQKQRTSKANAKHGMHNEQIEREKDLERTGVFYSSCERNHTISRLKKIEKMKSEVQKYV